MKFKILLALILFSCLFTNYANAADQLQVNLNISGNEKVDGNYSSIDSITVHIKADSALIKEILQNTPDYGPVLESWLKLGNKPPVTGPKLIYGLDFYSPDGRTLYSTDIVFFARKYSVVSENGQRKPVSEVVDETNIVIPVKTEIDGTYKLLISRGSQPLYVKNITLEKNKVAKKTTPEEQNTTKVKVNTPTKGKSFSDFMPILLAVIGLLLIFISFFTIVLAIKRFPRKPEARCPFCHKTLFDEDDNFCCYCGALLKPEKKQDTDGKEDV